MKIGDIVICEEESGALHRSASGHCRKGTGRWWVGVKGRKDRDPSRSISPCQGDGKEKGKKDGDPVEEVVGEAWAWEKGGERHRDRHEDISSCSEMLWVSHVLLVASGPAFGMLGPSGALALSPCCLPPGCPACCGLSLLFGHWWFL